MDTPQPHPSPAAAEPPARAASVSGPLPRPFLALSHANLAAQAAEQISLAAVPIVAVLLLHAGPREIGWLATAQSLPFLLLSIPCGLLADRGSRRAVMLAGEALRSLALLGLLAVSATGTATLGWLALLGFLGATGTVAFTVAAPALVPRLVGAADLGRANSRLEVARSLAYAGGPALAGAIVAAAGAPGAFALSVALALAALGCLSRLPRDPAPDARSQRHPLRELIDGGRFVWEHALLRPIFNCAVVWNLSWFMFQAAFVPHAMKRLGMGAGAVGLTLACHGIGMVLGALAAPAVLRRWPFGWAIVFGPVCSFVAASLMLATAWLPWPPLTAVAFIVFGVGPAIWVVSTTTLRQTVTRSDRLGRVGALFLTANAGARPLGAAAGAAVGTLMTEDLAITTCLALAAIGFALQMVIISASAVRTLRQLPPAAN